MATWGSAAEVHDGDVRAFGGGDVKLGHVTGTLTKSNGDNSDIYVGGPAIVDTIVGQVAKAVANGDKSDTSSGHHSGVHLLMLLVLGIAAFILWRIMRRPRRILRPTQSNTRSPDEPWRTRGVRKNEPIGTAPRSGRNLRHLPRIRPAAEVPQSLTA